MSLRKNSKKWKKTNKNLNKKQKGGAHNPENGKFSTNDFFNYYLDKYSKSINIPDGELFKPFDASEIPEKTTQQNILYVIDMQNDFIDDIVKTSETITTPDTKDLIVNEKNLYRELAGPSGTGNFSVTEGNVVIQKIIDFIDKNHDKFDKIIFTRDWHPRDHCSFNDKEDSTKNIGHYPPHCIFNTLGADFAPAIKAKIKYRFESDINPYKGFIFKTESKEVPIDRFSSRNGFIYCRKMADRK
jgi:nicotinamidase-related amidase